MRLPGTPRFLNSPSEALGAPFESCTTRSPQMAGPDLPGLSPPTQLCGPEAPVTFPTAFPPPVLPFSLSPHLLTAACHFFLLSSLYA